MTPFPFVLIILEMPGLEPVAITILDDNKVGIDAPDEVTILREELIPD